MDRFQSRAVVATSAIGVSFLHFFSPSWFTLMGTSPCWEVLWLIPFSLLYGPTYGVFAGLSLGLILDATSLGDGTQVPVLLLLGFWWGRLGRRGTPIDRSFSLGLLACLGSCLVGLSVWLQLLLKTIPTNTTLFNHWSLHTLLAQVTLTSLMAPIICSWLLVIFRRANLRH